MTRKEAIIHNLWQFLVSFDQAFHCFGGFVSSLFVAIFSKSIPIVWADETLSSRCWRWHLSDTCSWPCKIVDTLFWWDKDSTTGKKHCELSYDNERNNRQLPPELRN